MTQLFTRNREIFLGSALLLCLLVIPKLSTAQLAEPNEMGVGMGHIHFRAVDVEAANEFWQTFGAEEFQMGPIKMFRVPGVRILTAAGEPSNGSIGTMINHVGFLVPDTAEAYSRWQAAGIDVEQDTETRLWVNGPEGARIEVQQDADQDVPLKFHHIHWFIEEVAEMQAWYAEMFGAVPGMRAIFQAGDIPGANLTFGESEETLLPTSGTVLDHIGFELADLKATIAHLESKGITLDQAYTEIPPANVAIAFVTDPWGTRIELTQDL